MNTEQANQLIQIYNTLMLVNTNGRDSILMGKCLEAFENLLPSLKIETTKDNAQKED